MIEKENYVNNFLKSEEFNKKFHSSNEASLEYIDAENIKTYLKLFSSKNIDKNFLNSEIENNYIEGNYGLLLQLYEYAIKYGYTNETNTIFALLATVKLNDKKAKQKVLNEAKKKKIKLKLLLIFMLRIQVFLQKIKKLKFLRNKTNILKRRFLLEIIWNKEFLQNLKQKEKDKNIIFLKNELKKALNDNRFNDALSVYNKAYFSNFLNIDIKNYGEKAIKKVDNINKKEDIKSSLNKINYKIIFNEDKHLINKAIKMCSELNNYNIVLKYKDRLKNIKHKNNFKKLGVIKNAIDLFIKNKTFQRN